jgi:uncharacterized membrane protein (DUF2068 family)
MIAVLKFLEAAGVILAGLATLKLLTPSTLDSVLAWSQALPGPSERHFVQRALDHLSGITPRQVRTLGLGAFLFAAIFLLEGVGLWLERRWAEWLSIVATSLFIPLELLEIVRHVSAPKLIALIVNVVVVVYLIARIVQPGTGQTHKGIVTGEAGSKG